MNPRKHVAHESQAGVLLHAVVLPELGATCVIPVLYLMSYLAFKPVFVMPRVACSCGLLQAAYMLLERACENVAALTSEKVQLFPPDVAKAAQPSRWVEDLR